MMTSHRFSLVSCARHT